MKETLSSIAARTGVSITTVSRILSGNARKYRISRETEATGHLISAGHRRISCIQGVKDSTPNAKRVKGYLDSMSKAGLAEFTEVVGNEFSIRNGYVEARRMLSGPQRPTAIFALSNTIALGVLKAVREASLRIPEDISVIAFDDYTYMDYLEPPVTRISQPVQDMAKLATKLLLDRIESSGAGPTSQIKLSPTLIYGASVKHLSD